MATTPMLSDVFCQCFADADAVKNRTFASEPLFLVTQPLVTCPMGLFPPILDLLGSEFYGRKSRNLALGDVVLSEKIKVSMPTLSDDTDALCRRDAL